MISNKKDTKKTISSLLQEGGVLTEHYRTYMDGGVYTDYKQIPEKYSHCLVRNRKGESTRDYMSFVKRKKDWILEPLEGLQPSSYSVLQEQGGPFLVGMTLIDDPLHPHLPSEPYPCMFFDVCGRMIEVRARIPGTTYEDGNDCSGALLSLPEELAKSWLWRTDGWRIPSELPEYVMTNRQLIGHPTSGWQDTDDYLDSLGRGWKKKYLARILERFPDSITKRNGITRYRFRCFLDTRPSNINGPVGDQFFVCSTRQDKVVYHIHHGDVDNIRVLHNPAEAIDRYCAHTLLRTPHEFDFMPWSEPFTG